jgi:hypothetical protein
MEDDTNPRHDAWWDKPLQVTMTRRELATAEHALAAFAARTVTTDPLPYDILGRRIRAMYR